MTRDEAIYEIEKIIKAQDRKIYLIEQQAQFEIDALKETQFRLRQEARDLRKGKRANVITLMINGARSVAKRMRRTMLYDPIGSSSIPGLPKDQD